MGGHSFDSRRRAILHPPRGVEQNNVETWRHCIGGSFTPPCTSDWGISRACWANRVSVVSGCGRGVACHWTGAELTRRRSRPRPPPPFWAVLCGTPPA